MDARGIEASERVPASRKLGRDDATRLVEQARRVIVAKGKKVRRFPGGKATEEVVEALLGPTGNLRAPTIRVGKTLLVGFDEAAYDELIGA
jgi:hypothetical protein